MKNGFTLVELLAVIVILAVLALIATPVVLSIIDDAKESAMLRSAEMYLSGVENAVMRENMNSGGNFRPNECSILNGNMTCGTTNVEVEVDGEVPSTGSIVFENGKIKEVTLNYESGTIVKDSSGNLVYEGSEDDLVPGLYDENDVLLANWEELENVYGLDITADYDEIGVEGTMLHVLNNEKFSIAKKIVISDKITKIGDSSFHKAENLTTVIIPNSVKRIESSAFALCYNLEYVQMPESMEYIGSSAFMDYGPDVKRIKLRSIAIPNGITTIKSNTFESSNLEYIDIPKSVTSIEQMAFAGCIYLTTINYEGTMAEWNNINLNENDYLEWNMECPEITVRCSDGNITIPAYSGV